MAGRHVDWSESVSQLRDVFARLAVRCRDSGDLVEQGLTILNASERSRRQATSGAGPDRRSKRGHAISEYRIEPGAEGDMLVEVRSTGAQPFRCPEEIFKVTAEVLADVENPISFDELRKRASRALKNTSGLQPPIYLFRVVLRFLKIKHLLQHSGRRFRPSAKGNFTDAAQRAWRQTHREPLQVKPERLPAQTASRI